MFGFNGPEWVGIAQHYGRRTRLVDVTFNQEFALFFACWDLSDPPVNETEDGWVYIFARKTFRPMSILREDVESRSIEQGISTDFRDLFNESTASKLYDDVGHLYTPRADRVFNRRMAAQAGAFLWWHPPDQEFPHQLICIKVNRKAKGSILKELDAKGISIDVLFPDKLGRKQLRLAQ
jgi:hypothetical protein